MTGFCSQVQLHPFFRTHSFFWFNKKIVSLFRYIYGFHEVEGEQFQEGIMMWIQEMNALFLCMLIAKFVGEICRKFLQFSTVLLP